MDRWLEVDRLFVRALDLSAEGRRALVSEIRERDPALADELEALLEAAREGATFLEDGIIDAHRDITWSEAAVSHLISLAWTGGWQPGQLEEGERLYREALERRGKAFPGDSVARAYILHGLGWVLAELDQGAEAELHLREMTRLLAEEGHDLDSYLFQVGRSTLGRALVVQGRYSEAKPLLEGSYRWFIEHHPDQEIVETIRTRLVQLYEARGRPGEAPGNDPPEGR